MTTSPNERIQALDVLLPYAICGLVFLLPFSYASPLVNLVAGVVLLGAGTIFVGGAGLIPGLFLIGSALASWPRPDGATIAGRETGGGRSLMGWLRDRRAYTADLSAIVVQAGAADRLVDRDAGAAKATLASIRRPGPRDLPSLRQLVGVVRESDEAGRRAPQPTLERLDELVEAVRVVAGGHGLAAPQVTRRLIAEFARSRPPAPPPDELRGLTNRERVILELVARGLSNAEIGQQLSVSPSTVKTHVGSLLAKLGCRDRVQVVVDAYEHGVVPPGEDATGPGADEEEGRR